MPEIMEARFRIVTPMFLGGANQDVSDGIRPPSVKGALRFWWRALNWGRFAEATACDEIALSLLHDEEVRLFGGSSEQGGQGEFLLSIIAKPTSRKTISDWPVNNTGEGYLAFGIIESGSHAKGNFRAHRQGVGEEQGFDLRLAFRPRANTEDRKSIFECVRAWGLFGGLGSRARRGMGSITLVDEDGNVPSLEGFQSDAMQIISSRANAKLSPYTAFTSHSYFRILNVGNRARDVLRSAGLEYKNYRGQPSELRGATKIPFGLPLQGVDESVRRASPLFFHVHSLAQGQYAASLLYLPTTRFHPKYPDVSPKVLSDFVRGSA